MRRQFLAVQGAVVGSSVHPLAPAYSDEQRGPCTLNLGLMRSHHDIGGAHTGTEGLVSTLDECNGYTTADGEYRYVLTPSPPWVLSCLRGARVFGASGTKARGGRRARDVIFVRGVVCPSLLVPRPTRGQSRPHTATCIGPDALGRHNPRLRITHPHSRQPPRSPTCHTASCLMVCRCSVVASIIRLDALARTRMMRSIVGATTAPTVWRATRSS